MILFFSEIWRNILWIIMIVETFQLEPGNSFNIIVCLQMCIVCETGGCTYTEREVFIRFHIHVCAQVYIIIKVPIPISKEGSILTVNILLPNRYQDTDDVPSVTFHLLCSCSCNLIQDRGLWCPNDTVHRPYSSVAQPAPLWKGQKPLPRELQDSLLVTSLFPCPLPAPNSMLMTQKHS